MAIKQKKKDLTPVTLVATAPLSPYNEGEIFTLPKYQADQLLDENREDADGKPIPVKVEKYNPASSTHQDLLRAQRGKDGDKPVRTQPDGTPILQERQDARNDIADAARPVAEDRAKAQEGEMDQARVEKETAVKADAEKKAEEDAAKAKANGNR